MADLRVLQVKLPYEASKWLKIPALLDSANLKEILGLASLYPLSGFTDSLKPVSEFSAYDDYIEAWKKGEEARLKDAAYGFTLEPDALYALQTPKGYMIKPAHPAVQITSHYMNFSDGEVKSNVFGSDTLSWGVQFAFPQLHLTEEGEVGKHLDAVNFPLFKKIQAYLREKTVPAKFVLNGVSHQSSIRISKPNLEWVNVHPWLKKRGLEVKG